MEKFDITKQELTEASIDLLKIFGTVLGGILLFDNKCLPEAIKTSVFTTAAGLTLTFAKNPLELANRVYEKTTGPFLFAQTLQTKAAASTDILEQENEFRLY